MFDKKIERKVENVTNNYEEDTAFTVLNKELERMHSLFIHEYGRIGGNHENATLFFHTIEKLQKALLLTLEKGATEDVQKQLRDLQNTVTDSIILGGKQ